MASNYPRPIYELTDNTPRVPFVPADRENLFAPFVPFFAEKGPVGKIMYSGDVSFGDTFGTAMVDINSKFHTLSNGFVNAGLNGPTPVNIYGVRLCDPAATAASAVITLTPTPMQIPQYQTDALGNRMLDANNQPIPLMGSDGKTQVVEPGIVLVWGLRPLATGEAVDAAQTTTVTSGSQTLQCYPIVAVQGSSVGSALNNNGLKLYRPSSPSTDIESRIGSVLYRFAPYYLDPTLDTTASAVMNSAGVSYTDVSFKPNAVDPLTATAYNFTKLIYSKYYDSNSLPLLDMNISVYSANLKTVGDMCLAASPELATSVTDSWSLDLMTAIDASGIPYRHIAIDPSSAKVISATVINYLSGGTDGDTSEAMFQSQLAAYINNASANGFKNIGRYQFTHMFDPGWPIALKKQFISLLGQRQLLKLVISTQDASLPPNTMDQDVSTAEALAAVLALYPESMATANISAIRADICYHTAKLAAEDLSADPVPMITYKRFYQLAQYHGGQYITGSPCGEPGSFITEFRPNTVNWVPDDEDQMDAAYAKKAIYAQYASRNQLFIPFLRSAGAVDSSVLSGSNFVDLLLYKMKLCFGVWAKASGSDTPHKELFPTIQNDITTRFRQAFGSSNTDTIVLQQTVGDANDGDKVHAYITNYSDPDLRDITFSFILERASDASSVSTSTTTSSATGTSTTTGS